MPIISNSLIYWRCRGPDSSSKMSHFPVYLWRRSENRFHVFLMCRNVWHFILGVAVFHFSTSQNNKSNQGRLTLPMIPAMVWWAPWSWAIFMWTLIRLQQAVTRQQIQNWFVGIKTCLLAWSGLDAWKLARKSLSFFTSSVVWYESINYWIMSTHELQHFWPTCAKKAVFIKNRNAHHIRISWGLIF